MNDLNLLCSQVFSANTVLSIGQINRDSCLWIVFLHKTFSYQISHRGIMIEAAYA